MNKNKIQSSIEELNRLYTQSGPLFVTKLESTDEGLFLFLESFKIPDFHAKILFQGCLGYRVFEEADMLLYLVKNPEMNQEMVASFSKSDFLDWYVKQGIDEELSPKIQHFVMVCDTTVLEVISSHAPTILGNK